jgi:hypothetical protein
MIDRRQAIGISQAAPARMSAGERLLDDVLGRGLVTHHEQRQPYQPEMMFGEQRRDVDAVPGQGLSVGEQFDFHITETPGRGVCCFTQRTSSAKDFSQRSAITEMS